MKATAVDHNGGMLVDGINHVAVLTADTDRLVEFYGEVFGATVDGELRPDDGCGSPS